MLKGIDLDVPDNETFRGLPLAIRSIRTGGSMPTAFNASNEWANAIFRRGGISFMQIYDIIEDVMDRHKVISDPSVEEILAVQEEIDRYCAEKYGR